MSNTMKIKGYKCELIVDCQKGGTRVKIWNLKHELVKNWVTGGSTHFLINEMIPTVIDDLIKQDGDSELKSFKITWDTPIKAKDVEEVATAIDMVLSNFDFEDVFVRVEEI